MGEESEAKVTFERAAVQAWRLVGLALAAAFVVLALAELRVVVLPVLAALVLGTFLIPPVRRLGRRGWPRGLAAFAVLAVALAALTGLFVALAPPVADELRTLDLNLQEGFETVAGWVVEGPLGVSETDLDRAIERAADELRDNAGALASGVLSGAAALGELVVGLLLTVVLLFFLLRDGEGMWRWVVSLFDERRRSQVSKAGARGWEVLGGYLRGTTLVALFDAAFIGLGLWVIGVPLVLPLALLTFFGAYVPVAGAVAAGLAAALVALVTEGVVAAVAVSALVLVVQQVESNILQPVVVGRSVRLHPVAVTLSVTAGAVLGGIIGALIAVPSVAVAAAVLPVLRRGEGSPP